MRGSVRCIMQRMLLTLLDGTTVFVRPIAPEDKPLLVQGLRRLSPRDRLPALHEPEDPLHATPSCAT